MQLIHRALITLAGTALLATGLPALAQSTRPLYNTPGGGGGSSAPYDFSRTQQPPAIDPMARYLEQSRQATAQMQQVAARTQLATMARHKQIEQSNQMAMSRLYNPENMMGTKRQAASQSPRTTSSSAEQSGKKVRMIYKKPEDKEKEPGRIFNLKWR